MEGAIGLLMSWGIGVAERACIEWAVDLKVGLVTAGVAGQCLWVMSGVGGRRWDQGGRGTLLSSSSTFHKGSSDLGSKRRKVLDCGVLDVKGRSARVVICW